MHVMTRLVDEISIYVLDVNKNDMWLNVSELCGEFTNIPDILRGVDSPRLYCGMTDKDGTIIIFNTGSELYVVDPVADHEFLEYYEAVDEQVDALHIREFIQMSML